MVFKISRSRMDAGNGRVDNANFKQYGETTVTASTGATYTVNLSTGNTFKLTLTANCAITFANPLAAGTANIFTLVLIQDGGSRGVTWPAAVKWASGTAPTLATAAGAIDTITFMTVDGGTRYFGFPANGTTTALTAASGSRLFAWGRNASGWLGLGDAISRSSPTQIGTLDTWSSVDVSTNNQFSVATKTDGTMWAWGLGSRGYLGTSTVVDRSSPTQVGALIGWSNMSSNYSSTFAVKADGTMWAWGFESLGQLGIGVGGGLDYRSSPVQIGTLTTWSTTATGRQHTLALKTDGTLWMWGRGTHGEIGDGTAIYRSSPTQVGTLATWSGVSAGKYTSFAVRTDGSLWAWGDNSYGYLGLRDVVLRSSPTQVGTLVTWARVGAAYTHTFAVDTSGRLWAWGKNNQGNLGLGDQGAAGATSRSSPTQVGNLTTWSQATGGSLSSRALMTDGTMWTWGSNGFGELGVTDIISRSSPVQVTNATGWVSLGGGITHALALQDPSRLTGKVPWVWGTNTTGELGLGDVISRSSPVQLASTVNWSTLSGGYKFQVGLKSDGTVWTWGEGAYGKLGVADVISRSSPVQVGTLATWSFAKAHAGSFGRSVIAVKSDGTLWAWGRNNYSQLAQGDYVNRSSPVQIGTLATWASGAGARSHTLAVKTDGTLWIWGYNNNGQLGRGNTSGTSSPVQVGTLATWSVACIGSWTTAAIKTDGTLWTWGQNSFGQLGLSTDIISRSSPVQVGTLATWTHLATTGGTQFTARRSDGTIWAWGRASSGTSGLGDIIDRSSPSQIGTLATWASVSSGNNYTNIAIKTDGSLWAWGAGGGGALGNLTATNKSSPVQIGTLTDWVSPGPSLGAYGGHAFRLG